VKEYVELRDVTVIAPNFKRRLSGVTSTIVQLVPALTRLGLNIAVTGPGLPGGLPHVRTRDLWRLWQRPSAGGNRVWHARRNTEMAAGIVMRDLLRMPLKLVFTSAAQRRHQAFTKWLIRRMDRVVATSERSGLYLDVRHDVILHGIDTDAFQPALEGQNKFSASGLPGKHAIGCSGRIRHQKGTDIFVASMIELLPLYPDWTAIITGRATAEHQGFQTALLQQIAGAGLSKRILFLGEVEDIKLWYRRFSLFVAPSRNEGFGLTPLEAMASGSAVVTSDAGAYSELVGEGAGCVVPAGDGGALTRAISIYMQDIEMTRKSGDVARKHVLARFRLENEARALLQIYAALTGQER
jgi:mannosyltransferase